MSRHQIVHTRSGALAMRCLETGEVMHPGVGPLVEAEQLYVRQSRLDQRLRQADGADGATLVVFDAGMGAGSNAAAALASSERAPAGAALLVLVSFERDLDALRTALLYPQEFGLDGGRGDAARALLRTGRHQTARSTWILEHGDLLQSLSRQTACPDVVFWDPFSPRADPAPWTVAAFTAVRRLAGPRCTLFTYSASTAVRVALLLAGWAVGVGDATGTKAATTAAAVRPQDLARPLDRRWLGRLTPAAGAPPPPLPPDAPADAIDRVVRAPQFADPPSAPAGSPIPAPPSG